MTILIHAINDEIIAYPATLDALRREFPNCSFPIEPTAEDLAPFNRFFVAPIPAPSCDPRTERTEHDPTLTDDGWQQAWTIRPATADEITAYDLAHAPAPDWATFKTTALNSATLNAIVADAFQSAPVAAAALAPALLRAEGNGAGDFAAAWSAICAAVPVPAEVIAGFQQVATACHLPEEFVGALAPPSQTE